VFETSNKLNKIWSKGRNHAVIKIEDYKLVQSFEDGVILIFT